MKWTLVAKRYLPAILVLNLLGCGGQMAYREGQELISEGRVEEGLQHLDAAVKSEPLNAQYRLAYLQAWDRSLARLVDTAERLRRDGKAEESSHMYRRVLAIDPNNARAKAGLEEIAREKRHQELMVQAEAAWAKNDAQLAQASLRAILVENPQHAQALALRQTILQKTAPPTDTRLSAKLSKPISIEFRDLPLKQVLEVISRTSGVNFVLDKDVQGDQKTTVFLRDSSIQEAINIVLLTNQLEQRVLDKNSILIYPNSPLKAREYQPLMVRTFFLSNSDVKSAANTVKTIVKTRDMVVDERQNMLIVRDTPEAIRVAERLMALHDLPEPEVMLEVEILEVTRTRLQELGIQWPNQLILAPLANANGTVTLADLQHLHPSQVGATLSPMTINARKQDGDVKILANPRIRTRSRESAKVLIGDRVPNITTTATATGFVAESIQYVDVGLKLDVQPTIYADNEIAIKLGLEVSSIVNQIQTKAGSLAYQIGTRTTTTVLRLKDGENQVLAGLINDEDRGSANKVPLLGDIPLVGRLFGSRRDETLKTEIILSITPRLIRNIQRPALVDVEFDSGTETNLKARPGGFSGVATPAAAIGFGKGGKLEGGLGDAGGAGKGSGAPALVTALRWQGPAQVKRGDSVTLALIFQPDQPITGFPLSVSYDPTVLEVTSVEEGDFLKEGGATTNFSSRIDPAGGQVHITAMRTGADGAATPGSLASVTFRAIGTAPETKVGVTAIAPVGLNGKELNLAAPAPYSLVIGQ